MTTMSEGYIYIVCAECGEYSDKSEWLVRAFTFKDEADEYRRRCENYAKNPPPEADKYAEYDSDEYKAYKSWESLNPYDDKFSSYWDTPIYSVTEVLVGWPTSIIAQERLRADEAAKRKAEQKTRAIMLDD
jgi:hypothetical protein